MGENIIDTDGGALGVEKRVRWGKQREQCHRNVLLCCAGVVN